MSRELLAENMRSLRVMRHITVSDMAKMVDRAPNTIINYETGKRSPDVEVVEQYCNIFNVSPDQIFGWSHCKELDDFKEANKQILNRMEVLRRQKAEIERQLRAMNVSYRYTNGDGIDYQIDSYGNKPEDPEK